MSLRGVSETVHLSFIGEDVDFADTEFMETSHDLCHHIPYAEEEWLKDMRHIYEVYETINPLFTIPNPDLPSPRLPQEICLLIIDQIGIETFSKAGLFGDDVEALWACCLTCHVFLQQSHSYLYRKVILYSKQMVQSFFRCVAQNISLQGLTTHLELLTPEVEAFHWLLLYGHNSPLPNLQSLRLRFMPILHPLVITSVHHRHSFDSVTILHLWNCEFTSILDLRRFIDNLFPNVSFLDLHQSILGSSFVPPSLPHSYPGSRRKTAISLSRLVLLDVNNGTWKPIQQWLASTPTLISIVTLQINCRYLTMILLFGVNIQNLLIEWKDDYDIDTDEASVISFGPHLLPKLKLLHIEFLHLLPQTNNLNISKFLTVFSRSSPSLTLKSIQIGRYKWRDADGPIDSEPYKQLDDIFVSLLPCSVWVEIDVETWVYLPKLKKRGVLGVPTWNDDDW
ncbi:hypothetical protein C8Q75DRAFT_567033 [Abortiporus biennis]|nr:hypothetical protein C8Q75DRAFT_567033 [Abortiporus biennis]